MFHALGSLVTRRWLVLLLAWIALAVGLKFAAPEFEDVAEEGQFAFLPADAPSRRAEQLLDRAFPNDRGDSNIVILLRRTSSGGLQPRDRTFIREHLEPALRRIAESEGGLLIEEERDEEPPIKKAADAAEATAAALDEVARDQAESSETGDQAPTSRRVETAAEVADATADALDEIASNQSRDASNESDSTAATRRPIVARIVTPDNRALGPLLLSRDGQAALVMMQLTTEFLGGQNERLVGKIEALLDQFRRENVLPAGLDTELTGSALIGTERKRAQSESAESIDRWSIYLVILLLVAIYRAPLLAMLPLLTIFLSVRIALRLLAQMAEFGWVGLFNGLEVYTTVLVYGAGVDYALFLLSRAREEMEQGRTTEQAVAGSIGLVGEAIAASASTVLFGIGMMYFADFRKFSEAGVAIAFGMFIMLLASLTLLPALLRLTGRWAFWPQRISHVGYESEPRTANRGGWFNRLAEGTLLQSFWDRCAEIVLHRPGLVWVLTFALLLPFAVLGLLKYDELSFGIASDLPRDSASVRGFEALEEHFAAGATGTMTILLRDESTDFSSNAGIALVDQISQTLQERRKELNIADVRSVSHPVGWNEAAQEMLYRGASGIERVARRGVIKRQAIQHYVTQSETFESHVTRLDLIMTVDPFSREGLRTYERLREGIRNALPPELKDASLLFSGATASIHDLRDVARRDRTTIQVLVTSVVFVILVVLLRNFGVSLYLMLTVLLGFVVTLGITYLVFWLQQPTDFPGLDWTVTIFLFAVLVAVGIDYNIFLVTRVDEEQHKHGPVRGVTVALAKTGSIISSCGIIMAGTFFSLTAGGTLASLIQLGFALACGILLDTFVIRPFLVPSYLVLLNRGMFGPLSRIFGARLESPHTASEELSHAGSPRTRGPA